MQRGPIQVTLTADPTTITRGWIDHIELDYHQRRPAPRSPRTSGTTSGRCRWWPRGAGSVSPAVTTVYTLTGSRGEGEDAVSASAKVKVTVTEP